MKFSPQLPFDFSVSEDFTFANFLTSDKNAELVNLLEKIENYQEVVAFIWGKKGTGKSHLLQAICHANDEQGPLQALYLPLKKVRVFGPEVFKSLHHMDLICLDDFDCIVGEQDWEESLFEFFNRCREEGVKLIVSSENSPRGLDFELQDLASRMSWGVIYQLHELNDDEKLDALRGRAKERHLPLSEEVMQYIYTRHSRELQSLLDVMDRLDQLSLAEKRRLTIPFVRKVMDWQ